MTKRIVLTTVLLASIAVAGCGGEGGLKTYKVNGSVSIDGKPLGASSTLSLRSKEKDIPNVSGRLLNGKFAALTTYQPDDGAPAGEFEATLEADPSMPAPVPGVEPKTVTITPTTTTLEIDFKGTGKTVSPLAIPGQAMPRPTKVR